MGPHEKTVFRSCIWIFLLKARPKNVYSYRIKIVEMFRELPFIFMIAIIAARRAWDEKHLDLWSNLMPTISVRSQENLARSYFSFISLLKVFWIFYHRYLFERLHFWPIFSLIMKPSHTIFHFTYSEFEKYLGKSDHECICFVLILDCEAFIYIP